ncbi:ribose transport system substrate-binding protein [Caloramator quimbayensis]|uniref:Ribose transport system substrate-binding protein n=1 Tax=Caloramator quimbayensis TaxID=1147123 RepID=A0A1T4WKD1_9CLOT|nr:ribose ABC transporter substrate-binding protein RbsB [Caloramator quimbayensis]SKA77783.1 ribose transport system substrate-binding protein [Caloramator quimbayensis]
MKKLLKSLSILLMLTFILGSFSACTNKQQQGTTEKSKKIGVVISTLNNPFFVTMKEGAEKKAKELGYEVVVLDSQNDASKERSNVEDLVQQGIAVLVINPTDSDAVANSISVAKDKNIPVITVDRAANGVDVACHIASDNVAGGKLAGEFILETLGGKAKIVELQGIPGASATRDRGKGFHEAVDGKEGVKVVASQAADFDRQKGLNVMENIIQATPDFDAVFAHNDEMALGAVKALTAANKKAVVVGFDGTADATAAVQNGEMAATIAQQPDLMGSYAVENAVKLIKGESVEKQIPVALKVIKK